MSRSCKVRIWCSPTPHTCHQTRLSIAAHPSSPHAHVLPQSLLIHVWSSWLTSLPSMEMWRWCVLVCDSIDITQSRKFPSPLRAIWVNAYLGNQHMISDSKKLHSSSHTMVYHHLSLCPLRVVIHHNYNIFIPSLSFLQRLSKGTL
jgi:hypothetical protein